MGSWLERLLLEGGAAGDARRWRAYFWLMVVTITVCLAGAMCSGCGGAPAQMRQIVHAGAVVLVEVDRVAADRYREEAERALEESASLAEYHERMAPMNAVQESLQSAAAALEVSDALIGAWNEGAEGRWSEVMHHLMDAYEAVMMRLRQAGIEPPDNLFRFLGGIFTSPGEG